MLAAAGVGGDLVTDAHLAALAVEHQTTADQMRRVARGLVGKRLQYGELTA